MNSYCRHISKSHIYTFQVNSKFINFIVAHSVVMTYVFCALLPKEKLVPLIDRPFPQRFKDVSHVLSR